jgi:hypothetical protein
MEKFKEKKIVNILFTTAVSMFGLWIITLILSVFNSIFLAGFLLIPVAALCLLIGSILSDSKKYSREFIDYMDNRINKAKTLHDLYDCLDEFQNLAIENNMYCLDYAHDLRKIHQKIISQIEILEKQ